MVIFVYMLFGFVLIKDFKVWFFSDIEICFFFICIIVFGFFIVIYVFLVEEKIYGLC